MHFECKYLRQKDEVLRSKIELYETRSTDYLRVELTIEEYDVFFTLLVAAFFCVCLQYHTTLS